MFNSKSKPELQGINPQRKITCHYNYQTEGGIMFTVQEFMFRSTEISAKATEGFCYHHLRKLQRFTAVSLTQTVKITFVFVWNIFREHKFHDLHLQ